MLIHLNYSYLNIIQDIVPHLCFNSLMAKSFILQMFGAEIPV